MKNSIFSLLLLGISFAALGQATSCSIAENLPTLGTEGFSFKFKRQAGMDKDTLNCLPSGGGVSSIWGNATGLNPTEFSFSIHPTEDKLVLTFNSALQTPVDIFCRFPQNNCDEVSAGGFFDLTVDRRFQTQLMATSRCTVAVCLAVLKDGYDLVDGDAIVPRPNYVFEANEQYEVCAALSTFNQQSIDFSEYFENPIGFVLTVKPEAACTIAFTKLLFGEAATLPVGVYFSTKDGQLENTLINTYPTPSLDELNVDISKLSEDADLRLVSSNGTTVYSRSEVNGVHKVDVSEYEAGLYLLQIISDEKSITKRVIVQ